MSYTKLVEQSNIVPPPEVNAGETSSINVAIVLASTFDSVIKTGADDARTQAEEAVKVVLKTVDDQLSKKDVSPDDREKFVKSAREIFETARERAESPRNTYRGDAKVAVEIARMFNMRQR